MNLIKRRHYSWCDYQIVSVWVNFDCSKEGRESIVVVYITSECVDILIFLILLYRLKIYCRESRLVVNLVNFFAHKIENILTEVCTQFSQNLSIYSTSIENLSKKIYI